ncbi:hypothetical protein QYE76_009178 [Lolium multiflorum]|uniref:Uncharacterized protein n=1 Tax=Lolium multiflorum TaxID=4521 RepID=A0AAD8TRI9_LOLMU|nr:hypothetical protein QYE76_009178 [Lolium multiflorum]
MDRRVFGGLELPPAALQTIGAASVLTFVPVYDHLLVPALRYATGNPSGLTLLQHVGTGMAVSLATVSSRRWLRLGGWRSRASTAWWTTLGRRCL